MRTVVASELISLDGVMESPEEWASSYSNDEMEAANASRMAGSDALLLGRVTYEELAAYWPHQSDDDPMVDHINSVPKFVVSTTLENVEWNNSTLIDGSVVEEVTDLKQQPGKNITVLGSGVLVRSLLSEGALDELRLTVHPVILGEGKRLFESDTDRKAMELVDSETFETGVLSLTYRVAATEVAEAGSRE